MLRKTIILVDYNTQETARVVGQLALVHNVLIMPFHQLPDISIPINRVLAVVFLCTKTDDDVLQSLQTLHYCYASIKIIVVSPQPTPIMITQAVKNGANDYLDFCALEDGNLLLCLQQYDKKRAFSLSIFYFLEKLSQLFLFLPKPQYASINAVKAQSVPNFQPIVESLAVKWAGNYDEIAPPQYENFIKVQFFGDFRIEIKGKPIKPKSNSLLLAFLLFNHNRPIHKEILMSKFWGDNVNDAKNCLNAAIFSLRKLIGEVTNEKTIVFENDYYAINTAVWHIEADIDTFTKHWEKTRALIRTQGLEAAFGELNALKAMYQGDFLPNLNHEWALGMREEFREKHLQVLNLLCEYFWKAEKLTDCIDVCHDILRIDDCFEPTHRRLMQCFVLLHMKDKAIRQYKKCFDSLKKLNISPERETEILYASIVKT